MFEKGSIFDLVMHGSYFSYAILIILLLMSLISWGVAFYKYFSYRTLIKDSNLFLGQFNRITRLSEASSLVSSYPSGYPSFLFQASFQEYSHFYNKYKNLFWDKESSDSEVDPQLKKEMKADMLKRLERSIDKSITIQSKEQEKGLNTLAIISSSSPFIGLLGTVVGIIDAFQSIGNEGVTSLAVVAPGISEALIATSFGLFAAIPALMSFNFLRNYIRLFESDMYAFGLDLLNIYDTNF